MEDFDHALERLQESEIARLISVVAPAAKVVASDDVSTVASRKLQLRQALESYDVDRLLALQQTMTSFVDLVTTSRLMQEDAEPVLDAVQAKDLMARYLDQREINELMATVKDLIRSTVFSHLDATLRAEGVDDPANTNGTLEVPELGKRFCREGAGYKDPSLDEQRLRELLGDRWADVCDNIDVPEQVIPAHQEQVFSVSKALKLGRTDPAVMEVLRDCVIPGAPKTPKLMVRNISGRK